MKRAVEICEQCGAFECENVDIPFFLQDFCGPYKCSCFVSRNQYDGMNEEVGCWFDEEVFLCRQPPPYCPYMLEHLVLSQGRSIDSFCYIQYLFDYDNYVYDKEEYVLPFVFKKDELKRCLRRLTKEELAAVFQNGENALKTLVYEIFCERERGGQ